MKKEGEKQHVNDLILNSQMVMCPLVNLAVWQNESSATVSHSELCNYSLLFLKNIALIPEGCPVFSSVCPVYVMWC